MKGSLKLKLSLPFLCLIVGMTLIVNFLIIRGFKRFFLDNLSDIKQKELSWAAASMPDSALASAGTAALQDFCLFADAHLHQRTTFIDTAGWVRGDSRVPPDSLKFLENHRGRPEIRLLTGAPFAHDIHYSATLKMRMLYMACPVRRQGVLHGYLRFAIPLKEVEGYLQTQERTFLALTIAAFLFVGVLIYYFAGRIHKIVNEIGERAKFMETGSTGTRRYFGFSRDTDRLYEFLDETSVRLRTLIRDLTAQKDEMGALLRSVAEGVVAVDRNLSVRFANDNACRLFDSPHGSFSLPALSLKDFTRDPLIEETVSGCFTGNQRTERTLSHAGRSGNYELKAVCVPLRNNRDPGRSLVIMTIVDLTEEKRLAQAKAEFVEAASHELRTPLSVLKGYVETLEGSPGPDMARLSLDRIRNSLLRLENLTSDLLQLSYLESGRVALKHDRIDVAGAAREILEELSEPIREKGLQVSVEGGEPFMSVPDLVHIALYNLLTNAVKYNKPGGRIVVKGGIAQGHYEISVMDSGIGIPAEYRERVFERFFRADRHRSRETGGTGLGLAIVKHIASVLKGSVRIIDGLDGGAGFVLTLPVQGA